MDRGSMELRVVAEEKASSELEKSSELETSDVVDEDVKKWGLEIATLKSAKEGNFGDAKALLKKYGVAYLATSIPLALISFAFFYVLVDSGVDVPSLLSKVGISVDTGSTSETAGTAALAYVVHKAASPIRTIPVVALTPVVAELLGKTPSEDDAAGGSAE
mmetsp:Transcript_65379/g.131493  ORF Transcript_65379/g.131493 Transcript_65379/m.131493 type:complete len:161 (+) Transcript_65379:211-693(+)